MKMLIFLIGVCWMVAVESAYYGKYGSAYGVPGLDRSFPKTTIRRTKNFNGPDYDADFIQDPDYHQRSYGSNRYESSAYKSLASIMQSLRYVNQPTRNSYDYRRFVNKFRSYPRKSTSNFRKY